MALIRWSGQCESHVAKELRIPPHFIEPAALMGLLSSIHIHGFQTAEGRKALPSEVKRDIRSAFWAADKWDRGNRGSHRARSAERSASTQDRFMAWCHRMEGLFPRAAGARAVP